MINRRRLFGFAAVSPLVAFIPEAKAEVSNEDVTNSCPDGSCVLELQAKEPKQYGDKDTIYIGNQGVISISLPTPCGPKLGISVGRDGNMWIKVHDKWKRVVCE